MKALVIVDMLEDFVCGALANPRAQRSARLGRARDGRSRLSNAVGDPEQVRIRSSSDASCGRASDDRPTTG